MQKSMNTAGCVPAHIAIVMDGNGRWATKRFMPRLAGHKQGLESLRRCVRLCTERGVRVLTVFAFSSENWSRPQEEVSGLMGLMASALSREVPKLIAEGVRIHFVGERTSLPERVRLGFDQAEADSRSNSTLVLNICFNYGGRWDIAQAAAKLAAEGQALTEANLSKAMSMGHVPDPDLVIRTGGEMRISNFLLWQSAYAEFHFSAALWPEFGAKELDAAIADYAQRERRYGKTSAQMHQGAAECTVQHKL